MRPVNTVFQNYALFPLTVWDNVAFGLRYQDVDRAETRRRVGEALALARIEELGHRRRPSCPVASSNASPSPEHSC